MGKTAPALEEWGEGSVMLMDVCVGGSLGLGFMCKNYFLTLLSPYNTGCCFHSVLCPFLLL